jgi:RNA polymerase sigma-70 factor (ECF subfamily)
MGHNAFLPPNSMAQSPDHTRITMQALAQEPSCPLNFNQFYQNHELLVRAVVRQFNFHDAAADDLVQDIFIKAWRGLDRLTHQHALVSWLRVIARHVCLSEVKQQKKWKHLVSMECVVDEVEAMPGCNVFEITIGQLEKHLEVLEQLIQQHKDPVRREIACFFYLEQCSIREISERLQMNQNTVLSHLRRFRLVVSKAMQRWMHEQSSFS